MNYEIGSAPRLVIAPAFIRNEFEPAFSVIAGMEQFWLDSSDNKVPWAVSVPQELIRKKRNLVQLLTPAIETNPSEIYKGELLRSLQVNQAGKIDGLFVLLAMEKRILSILLKIRRRWNDEEHVRINMLIGEQRTQIRILQSKLAQLEKDMEQEENDLWESRKYFWRCREALAYMSQLVREAHYETGKLNPKRFLVGAAFFYQLIKNSFITVPRIK